MILDRFFGTYTFRFMITYVTALSVAAFILLSVTYIFYSYDYFKDINESLESELDILQRAYIEEGVAGIERAHKDKETKGRFDQFAFILADKNQQKIVGDFDGWPAELNKWSDGWLTFHVPFSDWQGNMKEYAFLARIRPMSDGSWLMAARVADDVRQNIRLVIATLFWGMVIMIMLGLVGAVVTSMIAWRRLEAINDTINTIMEGDFSERITIDDIADDFQTLSKNLNRMLDKIEDSMNDVRQVTDNIAHDLRTPLTRLRNKLSTLESRSAPENRDMVRAMLVEADHLLSTFGGLLRISQVESGSKRANFAPANISQIFMDVVELYEPLASVKDIALTIMKCDTAEVHGDRDLLFQMLANLLDNAIKYTPEGGAIKTMLRFQDNKLHIVFADNGPGVPEDKYEKVFQRFYRVEESRGLQPGNGLGLSLVRAVAVLHGGDITLSDSRHYFPESVTSGLTVHIELPLHYKAL